ncbi:hypothetical protein B0H10DRAFT_1970455 [Mycena sp. CBHHK59/15]|nr:hypothetical protein B0H10DRAFT_1970455 [Mycena sp. CBHHK59/15]
MADLNPLWDFFHRGVKQNQAHWKTYCKGCVKKHMEDPGSPMTDIITRGQSYLDVCTAVGHVISVKSSWIAHILDGKTACPNASVEAKAEATAQRKETSDAKELKKHPRSTTPIRRNRCQKSTKLSPNSMFRSTAPEVMPTGKVIGGRLLNEATEEVEVRIENTLKDKDAGMSTDSWKCKKKDSVNAICANVDYKSHLLELVEVTSLNKDRTSQCELFEDMIDRTEKKFGCKIRYFTTDADGRSTYRCRFDIWKSNDVEQFQLILGDYFKVNDMAAAIAEDATGLIAWLNNHSKVRKIFDTSQKIVSMQNLGRYIILAYLIANLTCWTTHDVAFARLFFLKEPLQFAVYTRRKDIIEAQVGATVSTEGECLHVDAEKYCALIKDEVFWHGLKTVLGDLEPICLGTNINQKDSTRPDQVLLTITGIFLHFSDHPEPEVKSSMLVRLEKRWKDCHQPVFLAALILNLFEMMTCFGPNTNLNQIKCLNMVVLLYRRVMSRPDNTDTAADRKVKEGQVSKAFVQYLSGSGDFRDFNAKEWEEIHIRAEIRAEHIEKGLYKPRKPHKNHKSTATLLSVPRYRDLLGDQDDEDPTECGRVLVSSVVGWRTQMAKWIGDAHTAEREETEEDSEDEETPILPNRPTAWKSLTLQVLFGGAEPRRCIKSIIQASGPQPHPSHPAQTMNKDALAEKARIHMAKHQKELESDPEAASRFKEHRRTVQAAYRARNKERTLWRQRLRREEESYKKLGGEKFRVQQRKLHERRDYEAEWETHKAQQQAEICTRVADAFSQQPGRCLPPFHEEQGITKENTTACYLVTSPHAKPPGRGVYPSWPSVQRVAENVGHGGGTKYSTYEQCLPAWWAGCDAGDDDHPPAPRTPPPSRIYALYSAPSHMPMTAARTPMTAPRTQTTTPRPPPPAPRTPTTAPCQPATYLRTTPRTPTVSLAIYAVRGSGTLHSSLDAAITDFKAAAAQGKATLCTTNNPCVAAYFAAGNNLPLSEALAGGLIPAPHPRPFDIDELTADESAERTDPSMSGLYHFEDGDLGREIGYAMAATKDQDLPPTGRKPKRGLHCFFCLSPLTMPKSANKGHCTQRPNRVHVPVEVRNAAGQAFTQPQTLTPKALATLKNATNREMEEQIASLSKEERRKFNQLHDIAEDDDQDAWNYQEVVDGNVRIELSHGGGELGDMRDELNEELNGKKQRK